MFLHIVRILQSIVEECVVIEDTLLDITAAKRAGMKCIAITTTYKRKSLHEADVIVDSFAQIGAYDFQHLFS
jgi:beta-phosphoglucomutase-like phosphatase (HAD superfamily)